jgi:hypothetical protein
MIVWESSPVKMPYKTFLLGLVPNYHQRVYKIYWDEITPNAAQWSTFHCMFTGDAARQGGFLGTTSTLPQALKLCEQHDALDVTQ